MLHYFQSGDIPLSIWGDNQCDKTIDSRVVIWQCIVSTESPHLFIVSWEGKASVIIIIDIISVIYMY